ncbi:replication initiation protein RepC [Rhizobium leguminosarum]|uniref:Replication initiation protein RepC n=1 Tax=Rhizobium leguminosarum TaxID=384 RepID=A0A1B1CLB8_RHILE|nr:plasmid replication protein RepC [Rhizobium leguminosarum]ANP90563.1 replication initiation protein RepC [Rhizobium leguminosarum]API57488.1 replication initiation protein RepC [Rhizobium leguminosarum]NEJ25747.1 replication initiation protein RepC [Rhizobium leguminosarum]
MHTESVTTPFGRRPMTLALVRRQQATKQIRTGKTADKWKIFRDASAAMEALRIQSSSLAVLDALLSFYPENELREDAQLIVFPSNLQLSLRAHSMPGSTLRRHLAVLVEAGLIVRRDSANGKRFSRKDQAGDVEEAFGFDLSPLLLRSEELAMLAQDVIAARAAYRKAKEKLTICRRDTRKLISAAMEEGAEGNWQAIEHAYISLVGRLPRTPTAGELVDILDEMEMLKQEILNLLEINDNSGNDSSNDAHIERHIQNSKPESIPELEPSSEKEPGAKPRKTEASKEPLKTFPLSIVLKACPQVSDYAPGGSVDSWRELMSAAVVIRSMLGVSPSAYQEACEVMGPENAAVAMACILERANLINSAGAYLRDLTRRADRDEFSIGPMLMAALKANNETHLRAG